MKNLKYTLIAILAVSISITSQAQLEVTPSSDADDLMENLLNPNNSITYANAILTGSENASGFYIGADFGATQGVLFSTGSISDAPGPNVMQGMSGVNNSPGDSELDNLLNITTTDAVSLEADLTPTGETIEFSFVFASEDYNEYVCSPFADAIGFFIDGHEYDNQNFALVPNTDLSISTNTINNGTSGDQGPSDPTNCPEGGLDNADLYIDNEGGAVIEYDGRTTVIPVSIPVTPGLSYNVKWVIADGFDQIFDSALFLEAGSLSSQDDCTADGGELIVEGETTVCKSDGEDDFLNLSVNGAEGENQTFVITWDDGEIFAITENTEFNLEGVPGNGTCLFWHLSWDGEIDGLEIGENAFDLSGDCFDLSEPVEVTEYFTNGGEISTDDPTTICAGDGEGDPIDVTLEGEAGMNSAWVITDADLNILDLPDGPPFDLDGAGEGVCLIWHLSWSGDLTGAEIGENAGDLMGDCFDLSNSIEVTRLVADGGEISTDDPTTICVGDGEPDPIDVSLSGEEGENMAWVITDDELNILDLPDGPPFDLEGAGEGVCLIWHLSWSGDLMGAEIGENAGDLMGDCFDLSNSIEVVREICDDCTAEGGELTIDGPTLVCKSDGEDDIINLELEGAEGENQTFLVTWADGEIFMITHETEFNLEGFPGNGICLFWSISWDGEIDGLEIGENAFDFSGDCFDLSEPVEVTEYFTDGGEISTNDPTTICVGDGVPDPIDVTLEGEAGMNSAWVITDADLNILDLPDGPPFDLDGAGEGVCLIWHLSWSGDLMGAEIGENAGDLMGDCFDLSNSIEVVREICDDCTAEGGELTIDGPTLVCKSDGEDDIINLELEGAEGENQTFLVTWADGEIFMITHETEFNLEGFPGNGICLFWSISWDGEIDGLEIGENAFDFSGDCFDLSEPVEVTEYFTDGGEISTNDPTTICVGDGVPDPIDVTLEGEAGMNSAWVITDADLNILDLPDGPPFDLDGAGEGVCLIWHLSWSGDLMGAEIGENAGDLMGDCFDLSNSIEVVREECGLQAESLRSPYATIMIQPNPSEGLTNVNFSVFEEERTTVEVYDMNGRLVETLFNQTAASEVEYRLEFDGSNLPNGVYICRMTNGREVEMSKIMIAR